MKLSTVGFGQQPQEESAVGGEKRCLNSELWHACAGPLVSLPNVSTRVVYFPQGHSEQTILLQVAASTNRDVEGHIPNYPNLPPQLICQLHDVTMHADVETDEVYAQMTLQPLSPEEQKENYMPIDMGIPSKQPTNYFCKTLTASDTSTHGGFSVPRRAAEKVFPPLDFSQQPPAQELIARDLHDVEWKFRHIFRGQPKRHLLTTGWSVFVSAKRLVAGDSVLFIWNEKNQLLLGIRRANRPQTVMPSSVLSSDSMHLGLLAAAAHAAATNSRFTIFYNPRASPSEFVIPLSKYIKAVFHTRVSVGMRFRMLFETEESSVRRYMGTITGISDLDPARWPNSYWRSVKVGWDESTAGERQPRVSLWEIEPLTTFPMYPSLFPLRLKRPWHPGISSLQGYSAERGLPAFGMGSWMQPTVDPMLVGTDHDPYQAMAAAALQDIRSGDALKQQYLTFQQPFQFSQQLGRNNPLLLQQAYSQQILNNSIHGVPENQTRNASSQPLVQPFTDPQRQQAPLQQGYQESFPIQNPQQFPLSSALSQKPNYSDTPSSLQTSLTPCMQNMLGSFGPDSSSNIMNFTRITQPMMNEMQQQSWDTKFAMPHVNSFANSVSLPPFPGKDGSLESESCTGDSQNHTLFGVNIDSSSLLSNGVPSLSTTSLVTEASTLPLSSPCFQNSLYGCMDDSSALLQSAAEVDPPTRNFVKVYKSGCVGRSLDIGRFSNYNELRYELGQMFGIEGLLEDPSRSGWQLVFVDRENDQLLLGDDPWESFVNNVWCIKILSPEDFQKMGKQSLDSLC